MAKPARKHEFREETTTESFEQYLRDIKRFPLINSADREKELIRAYRAGNESAGEELVKRNLRFVISVAKKYRNHVTDFEDLISEGNVGLLRSVKKFDDTADVKFISYAVWWVRQSVLAYIAKNAEPVHVPAKAQEDARNVLNYMNNLRQLHGYTEEEALDKVIQQLQAGPIIYTRNAATFDRVEQRHQPTARTITITERSLERYFAIQSIRSSESLDDTVSGTDMLRGDFRPTTEASPLERIATADARDYIDRALTQYLRPRDAKILRLYYGLGEGEPEPLTLEEIGGRLGVTRERVRQLRERAFKSLKAVPELRELYNLLEAK